MDIRNDRKRESENFAKLSSNSDVGKVSRKYFVSQCFGKINRTSYKKEYLKDFNFDGDLALDSSKLGRADPSPLKWDYHEHRQEPHWPEIKEYSCFIRKTNAQGNKTIGSG